MFNRFFKFGAGLLCTFSLTSILVFAHSEQLVDKAEAEISMGIKYNRRSQKFSDGKSSSTYMS
jgi:hypothetical protein